MSKGSSKTKEVKVPELERKIGDTPLAQTLSFTSDHLNDFWCVRNFLPQDAIRRIAVTAREHLRDRLVPDDD